MKEKALFTFLNFNFNYFIHLSTFTYSWLGQLKKFYYFLKKQSLLILLSSLVILDSRHLQTTIHVKHFYCFYYDLHQTKLKLRQLLDNYFLFKNYLVQASPNKILFLESFHLSFQEI